MTRSAGNLRTSRSAARRRRRPQRTPASAAPSSARRSVRPPAQRSRGSSGAGVGAGVGLLTGTAVGAGYGYDSAWVLQRRYDNAYLQCMYAKGNKVPVSRDLRRRRAQQASGPARPRRHRTTRRLRRRTSRRPRRAEPGARPSRASLLEDALDLGEVFGRAQFGADRVRSGLFQDPVDRLQAARQPRALGVVRVQRALQRRQLVVQLARERVVAARAVDLLRERFDEPPRRVGVEIRIGIGLFLRAAPVGGGGGGGSCARPAAAPVRRGGWRRRLVARDRRRLRFGRQGRRRRVARDRRRLRLGGGGAGSGIRARGASVRAARGSGASARVGLLTRPPRARARRRSAVGLDAPIGSRAPLRLVAPLGRDPPVGPTRRSARRAVRAPPLQAAETPRRARILLRVPGELPPDRLVEVDAEPVGEMDRVQDRVGDRVGRGVRLRRRRQGRARRRRRAT